MKKVLTLLLAVTFLGIGCTPPPTPPDEIESPSTGTNGTSDLSSSDFETPAEVDRGMGDSGPFEMRLVTARSDDGVTWERENKILSEQANTPDMIITADGTLFLYYVGGNILGKEQNIAAAVSQDNGVTWAFREVTLSNIESLTGPPGDPDIVLREDGSFRLYFTSQIEGHQSPSIQYADGTDGLHFVYQGEAFGKEGTMIMDSSAFYVGGHWAMNTFNGGGSEVIHGISSDDGDTFQFVQSKSVTYKGTPYFLSNPFPLEDGSVRFLGFQLHPSEFRSFITTDGLTWKDEGKVYLKYEEGKNPLEGFYIKDPCVVQLPDSTYLMVYVTRAPY